MGPDRAGLIWKTAEPFVAPGSARAPKTLLDGRAPERSATERPSGQISPWMRGRRDFFLIAGYCGRSVGRVPDKSAQYISCMRPSRSPLPTQDLRHWPFR